MKIIASRNKREGQYMAGYVIGFMPKKDHVTGLYGAAGPKRPNIRAGAGNIASYRKTATCMFVWPSVGRK